jgi:hypothetical protein
MLTHKTLLSGMLALAASAPLWIPSPPNPARAGAVPHLEGVWEIVGVPDASSGIDPFFNVVTIEAGGAMINADPEVGVGVGQAHISGPKTYTAGFFGFIDVGVEATFEVQSTLDLAGPDAFTGPFRTLVSDLAGNLLFEYEGVVHGTRRSVQPY